MYGFAGPGGINHGRWFPRFWLGLSLLAVILAYRSILFDFFLGDDFVHLLWLKQSATDPGLVLANFYGNWLNSASTSFYRPLISIFMLVDYELWGTNGLGFHVTNLCFHLATTTALFFLARGLYHDASGWNDAAGPADMERDTASADLYGFAAASIFGLYPLHPEAVSWITGRVDAAVGTFMCLALFSYRRWRQAGGTPSLILGCTSFVLALMSKEMAVTLPVVFTLYSFLLERTGPMAFTSRLKRALGAAWPFVLILVAYFLVRRAALGTFVGGYDDTLLPETGVAQIIDTWWQGLRMFLLPVNSALLDGQSPLPDLFELALLTGGMLLAFNLVDSKAVRRLTAFNLVLTALLFVPVYKVFAIAPDLEGSRYGYAPSLGFALIAAAAFIPAAVRSGVRERMYRYACVGLLACYLGLCFHALRLNNTAWANAGTEANRIRAALADEYEQMDGDPQVLLLGLPDNLSGAYVARNALEGMTRMPQFGRDVFHAIALNPRQPIIPFGYLKESLADAGSDVHILSWSRSRGAFEHIHIDKTVDSSHGATSFTFPGISAKKTAGSGPAGSDDYLLDLSGWRLSCFDLDVLTLRIETPGTLARAAADGGAEAVLYYSNRLHPQLSSERSIRARIHARDGVLIARFPLSSRADWALGGDAGELEVVLPVPGTIAGVQFTGREEIMPRLSFEGSGYLGSKGFLHLTEARRAVRLNVDASRVPGAASTSVAVTRRGRFFSRLNSSVPDRNLLRRIAAGRTDTVLLDRSMFPSTGLYSLRAWSLDKSGDVIGLAGDHIVVVVD